jgi:hypothetical protein
MKVYRGSLCPLHGSPNLTGPFQGIYMWSACRSDGDLKNVRYRTAPYRFNFVGYSGSIQAASGCVNVQPQLEMEKAFIR